MNESYCVVRSGQGKYQFTLFHDNYQDAKAEALRLAGVEKSKFLVLKLVGVAEQRPNPAVYSEMIENKGGI